MKVINMSIILLAVLNHFTIKAIELSSNWIVDIKNEKGDYLVELKPGQYTKFNVYVYNVDNLYFTDASFDKSVFIIAPVKNDFMFPNGGLEIIPSKSLRYATYLGVSCNTKLDSNMITSYNFYVKEKKSLSDDFDPNTIQVHFYSTMIGFKKVSIPINLVPVETNIVGGGYSLFRINEIYNVEKVIIGAEGYDKEKYVFDTIEIEPFDKRKKFDPEINENHGILFDFKFGTQFEYKELDGETNVTYNLETKVDDSSPNCFDIGSKSKMINITVVEKKSLL